MLTDESWASIKEVVEARRVSGKEMDRRLRAMGIISAVGEWNCNPTDEACAKITIWALALCCEQGIDLNAAIAKVTEKFGRPLPEGGSRFDNRKPPEKP